MAEARIITLGCRLNAFESEVMRNHARAAGLRDAFIVNTCAVTAEASRQARQAIRRIRRRNPAARIIVTGCAVQVDAGAFAAMPEVDLVLGNSEKMEAAVFERAAAGALERSVVSDIMTPSEGHLLERPAIREFEGRTRAFVQVQQGCDHRCTFCIIPYARGPSRSVPVDAIRDQVRALVGNGYAEVVLTGVDISSWGADLPGRPTLGRMARRLLADVPELKRLRLGSLDPGATDGEVFRLLADEPRLMPHLHLSLQAADDMVLKRMRRRHTRAGAAALCRRARRARPDVVFGADLIAGFPTETERMFANTLAAVRDLGLTYLHVFPYSPRPGTPAARMPQVPPPVRKERAARLRGAGDDALARYLESLIGTTAEVLVEKDRGGRSRHYAPVRLSFDATPGALVSTRITGTADGRLVGRRAA